MNKKYTNKFVLRALAIFVLASILAAFLISIVFAEQIICNNSRKQAVDGYLDLSDIFVLEDVLYLSGEWDAFEGVVCQSEEEVKNLGQAPKHVKLPIGGIQQANKNATYRLKFSLGDNKKEDLFLYISTFYKSADIYLNGVKQEYYQEDTSYMEFSTIESIVLLDNIDYENEWQELVITAPFKDNDITLHKREIAIGTIKNISALSIFVSSNEMLIFGLLLLILLNGYVFMMFRPEHKIISYMTIFDTTILLRVLLSMNYIMSSARGIFPWLHMSDRLNSSLSLFFLMLGGIVGCKLSAAIFDPEDKVPKWITKPMPWFYAVFALIFPLVPELFDTYGRAVLIPVYFVTFIGVFLQFVVAWTGNKHRIYNTLQFIKTGYIGVVIFIDIMFWNTSANLLSLFYSYTIFFMLHVVVRLYDNNESYVNVEILNESLEDTVEKRTKELSEANKVLSELSIKDPLTQIFNRLYFERSVEEIIAHFNNHGALHVCMFDLDFFKKINDTYGHNAGDEQLKSVCDLVSKKIEDKAIFARIGGEEFVLLFCDLTNDEVIQYVEDVRIEIDKDAKANTKHTTASFGIARFREGDNIKEFLKRADVALYEAKNLGRNRVIANFDSRLDSVEEHIHHNIEPV